jgi:UDP-N-acetylglucosamine diphosphorylase/glucosamine-1-phosphate N-acetyltransferase
MNLSPNRTAVVILAAGKGTRMKSDRAKVLHEISDRPMILYVVETALALSGAEVVVVIGHQAEQVRRTVSEVHPTVRFALQERQLGTGHAVQCALPACTGAVTDVVILCGDVPLLTPQTVHRLVDEHRRSERELTVLAVQVEDPAGYGRILLDGENRVTGIVEEADATEAQRRIRIVNSGIYCVRRGFLEESLVQLDDDNAQGELYLTDILGIGSRQGRNVGALVWEDGDEVIGVNTIADLLRAQETLRLRTGESA